VCAAVLAAPLAAGAQSGGGYDLRWSTLDCGSTTPSSGGSYNLTGSIGQAAAAGASGGGYDLQGGLDAPTDAPPDLTEGTGPLVFELRGNRPNPFVTTTAIAFSLPHETKVTLRVYDLAGRRVRTVVDERLGPGRHQAVWDARDDSGRRVAHGIYFLRLQAGELHADRKLALVP
jgi:hypothetical protein